MPLPRTDASGRAGDAELGSERGANLVDHCLTHVPPPHTVSRAGGQRLTAPER